MATVSSFVIEDVTATLEFRSSESYTTLSHITLLHTLSVCTQTNRMDVVMKTRDNDKTKRHEWNGEL